MSCPPEVCIQIPAAHLHHLLNSYSSDFTINGPLLGAIAYLQTGENILDIIEMMTSRQPAKVVADSMAKAAPWSKPALCNNGFSSAELSLIPSHSFFVTIGFGFFDGCDGAGADCTFPRCEPEFTDPSQTFKQVGCGAANVNLAVSNELVILVDD
ncbi:hypothetical protein B0H17DRAFT_1216809 [Mycena rosella]|uniref:Uncharacterized protein n=1 Tax=Mycena rosella TaxID=1033263 RepID=A0AAD7FT94_MYCRO|nr:hypothetical protein B0H17DRAFT_1216809 [Mycena rosella]